MNREIRATFLVAALGSFVVAADYLEIPVSEYPGGSLWAKQSSITVAREVRLTEPATIRADELILEKPLITMGHYLHIDVRKLVFRDQGKIVAFVEPAPQGPGSESKRGKEGGPGESFGGNKELDERYQGKQRDGGQGHAGTAPTEPGAPGEPGNQNPGEILVFAANVEGAPIIDGTGQKGGKGGKGPPGGQGGRGGTGSKADKNWHGKEIPGGRAGTGGHGGPGGIGGQGGKGGRAVKVTFIAGHLVSSPRLDGIVSKPGEGGEPGDYGDQGPSGKNGNGSSGDRNMWGSNTGGNNDVKPYEQGAYGEAEPPAHVAGAPEPPIVGNEALPGLLGAKASCVQVKAKCRKTENLFVTGLNEFEDQRFLVYKSWYAFHWTRALNLLVRDSFRLARQVQATRAQFDELGDAQVLTELNRQYTAEVVAAWRDNFIEPLEQARRHTLLSDGRGRMLEIASQVAELLGSSAPDLKRLRVLRDDTDSIFQEALEAAYLSCEQYNTLKTDLLSVFFGATKHYTVPVCSGQPNFSDKKNFAARIELTVPYPKEVSSDGLADQLGIARGSHALLQLFFLAPAYAQNDYKIVYVHDAALMLPQIIEGEPRVRPNVSTSGVNIGYAAPQEDEVSLESLGHLLRSLAIQLGAQG